MQINSDKTNKKKFFEVEHIHENPIESLDYARINKSVVCYNRTCCPAANHPVEQCQNPRKISDYFRCQQPVRFVSTRKCFANLGSFAKVSLPVYLQLLDLDDEVMFLSFVLSVYTRSHPHT